LTDLKERNKKYQPVAMKLLIAISSVALTTIPGWAMFVQKEPQSVRSALLETSSELRQMIEGFTVDPTGDLLGNVATMITDTMMPGILSAHNSTQHQLDAFGMAFNNCPSPKISTQATMLVQSQSSRSATRLHMGVHPVDGGRYMISKQNRAQGQIFLKAQKKSDSNPLRVRTMYYRTPNVYQPAFYWQATKVGEYWHFCTEAYSEDGVDYPVRCLQGYGEGSVALAAADPVEGGGGPQSMLWKLVLAEKSPNAGYQPYAMLNSGAGSWRLMQSSVGSSNPQFFTNSQGSVMEDWFFNLAPATTTTTTTTQLGGPQWIAATMGTLSKCRQNEGVADTAHKDCLKALSVLEGVKNSTCDSLKAQETAAVDQYLCTPTDPYEQWLITAKSKMKTLQESLLEKEAGCGNATTMYNDKAPKCDALKLLLDANKTQCDQLQATTEAGMCAGPVAAQRVLCEDYSTCYNNALAAYQEEKPTIEAMHLNWTVQWRTLKRMECLLGIMQSGGTNDDIDKCKEKTWPTDHLDLDYPVIPTKEECHGAPAGAGTFLQAHADADDAIPLPCEAAFLTKYYGSNPPGAPAATCTPCAPPPGTEDTTTTTTPSVVMAGPWGGHGGSGFAENRQADGKIISRLCIFSGTMIDAVRLYYWNAAVGDGYQGNHDEGRTFGGTGGSISCLVLERDEHITKVVVLAGDMVDGIEATTSTGKTQKWGGSGGGRHPFEVAGKHLIGITGRAGGSLDAFGVIFGR